MFDKIRQEVQQDYYRQYFPNDGQRFLAWYLRNIHQKDMIETRDCVTDGADDKQIDAVVIDDDKSTIYIAQGKFIGAERVNAEPLREVLASWIQFKDLVRLQEVGNTRLKRKLAEVAAALDDEYDVCFEIVTTASLTDSAKDDLATFQKQIAAADDLSATLHLVESLLAMKAYAPFHHLYAVSMCYAISSGLSDRVPSPAATWESASSRGIVDQIVQIAGISLNSALEAAANEPQPANRVFSPQNWIKTKVTAQVGVT